MVFNTTSTTVGHQYTTVVVEGQEKFDFMVLIKLLYQHSKGIHTFAVSTDKGKRIILKVSS